MPEDLLGQHRRCGNCVLVTWSAEAVSSTAIAAYADDFASSISRALCTCGRIQPAIAVKRGGYVSGSSTGPQ